MVSLNTLFNVILIVVNSVLKYVVRGIIFMLIDAIKALISMIADKFHRLFLYNILPKKRLLIAFIGFLISSTIITGAGILLTSIVDSTSSYLGESNDVLVISSPEASTPYTSILPLDLADTISTIEGVEIVSPEVMTAAVYENKAVYFRGVDVSKFWQLTNVNYLEGDLPSLTDSFEVSIGVNFAERNSLGLGDFFTLYSTRSEAAVELKVKSVFETGTLLDDEIIASLWIGQFFAFEDYDYITHIRVKIDLDTIPSKELLRELVLNEYSLVINIITPDSLAEVNATITIRTRRGELVNETIIRNDNQISYVLPFGEYKLQGSIEGILSPTISLLLKEDSIISLDIPYKERLVSFRIITDEDEPIQSAIIKIYSQNITERYIETRNFQALTDVNGEAEFTVSDGSYYADISYGHYVKILAFTTSDVNDHEIVLISRHPFIFVNKPTNNSLVIGNNLNLTITATTGYSINYYYDGNIGTTREYYIAAGEEIYPDVIFIPFADGPHSITVEAFNSDYITSGYNKSLNYATSTVYFTIASEIPSDLSFYNVMNGSQIEPNEFLLLNSTYKFNQELRFKWDNQDYITLGANFIIAPYKLGIHKLTLQASADDQFKEISYIFAITNNPNYVGTIGLRSDLKVKGGEYIQTWFNPYYDAYFNWNSNPMSLIPMNGQLNTTGLTDGVNLLNLYTYISSEWHNRSYTFEIDNNAPIISLSEINGSLINSKEYLEILSDEELSLVQFAWDDFFYSRAHRLAIQIPEENGNHSLHLRVKDRVGNLVELYYQFNVTGFNETTDPHDFYLENEYAGILEQAYVDIVPYVQVSYLLLEYRIEGETQRFGHVLGSVREYLFPGTYTLTVILWLDLFERRTRTWTFEIREGLNVQEIQIDHINSTTSDDMLLNFAYYDVSYNMSTSDTLFLSDGYYSINYQYPMVSNETYVHDLIMDATTPFLDIISPTKGLDGLVTELNLESDAAEILFQFSTEPTIYEYTRPQAIIFVSGGEHTVIFHLTDSYENTITTTYSFYVNQSYTPQELTFQFRIANDLYPINNLSVVISSYYNTSLYILQTNSNGTIDFNIFMGTYSVSFVYGLKNYDFVFDTSNGENQDIWLNGAYTIIEVRDSFANSTINSLYCIIRDEYGNRVLSSYTDSSGRIYTTNLDAGSYNFYFIGTGEGVSVISQDIYHSNNYILLNIPSKKHQVIFEFQYNNGTKIYNLPITITTELEGSIVSNTGLSSQVTLYLSYGIIDLTIYQKNGSVINLRRIFEPGITTIKIVLPSETDDQWSKIPFKSISGFAFLVSLSYEYVDYYLQGSLLFTYTLAYAEVLLILMVVIVNMNSIIQNLHSESRKESSIIKMIGGTNMNAISAIFSRLGVLALIASIIGYGFGNLVLIILSSLNQTVFFGHTFIPHGSWTIFVLNVAFTFFVAIVTTAIIARKSSKEKKITYSRRN
ncbi:MAG: FtsX-like permease family protein [Candidatus Heimdallarchaeaceae archaeon]